LLCPANTSPAPPLAPKRADPKSRSSVAAKRRKSTGDFSVIVLSESFTPPVKENQAAGPNPPLFVLRPFAAIPIAEFRLM
jgi:hypothetical protein